MKNISRGLLFLGVISIAACGSGGGSGGGGGGGGFTPKGVEDDGTCSSATIGSLNNIDENLKNYGRTEDQNYLLSAQKSCKDFKSLIGEQSCKTAHPNSSKEIHVSKDTAKASCDAVEAILNPDSVGNAPITVEPGTEITDETLLSDLPKGISLKVKDAATVNTLFAPEFVLQDGKAIMNDDDNGTSGVCKVQKSNDSPEVREYDVLDIVSLNSNLNDKRMLSGATKDRKYAFVCVLHAEGAEWKLKDLKSVFGDLVEIQIKN